MALTAQTQALLESPEMLSLAFLTNLVWLRKNCSFS